MDWLVAATYCEEEYGMSLNTKEGYFVCPPRVRRTFIY